MYLRDFSCVTVFNFMNKLRIFQICSRKLYRKYYRYKVHMFIIYFVLYVVGIIYRQQYSSHTIFSCVFSYLGTRIPIIVYGFMISYVPEYMNHFVYIDVPADKRNESFV